MEPSLHGAARALEDAFFATETRVCSSSPTGEDQPARVRIAAIAVLLDRGFGKNKCRIR